MAKRKPSPRRVVRQANTTYAALDRQVGEHTTRLDTLEARIAALEGRQPANLNPSGPGIVGYDPVIGD